MTDEYRWLEDAADPRTRQWSADQDGRFAAALAGWPDRAALHEDLSRRYAVGSVGAPYFYGDRAFAMRREPDQDHAVLTVTEPSGERRTLIDPAAIDPSGITVLDVWYPSIDGELLAYGMSRGGTELAEIRVLDVTTGEVVDGPIDRTRHPSIAWLADGKSFFYVRFEVGDEKVQRVRRHRLGTDPATDDEVFGAGLPHATYLEVTTSDDARRLTVTASRGTDARNDLWVADLTAAELTFTPVVVGADALTWPLFDSRGELYVVTNLGAPRSRVCRVEPSGQWHELVGEDPAAVIHQVAVLAEPGLLVVARTRHAVAEVAVHDLGTGERVRELELPGLCSVTELSARRHGSAIWLSVTDYATPDHVLEADAATGALTTYATPPGAQPSAAMRVRQITYPSYDGTPVRMFLIEPDGPRRPRPTVLNGYGGFNHTMTPAYAPRIQAWVAAGGVWAVAGLRGGAEEGEAWHAAGMRERKQNVFDDFAAASDALVADGVTTRGQLGIDGGSNGGLLVGAALTQHPAKYAAVVCVAPLLDMLRYHLFGLGELWTGEYGSPDDPVEADWLRAYSPYHHVTDGVAYPATLFLVFDGDTRVDPLHARKMCARMQAATAGAGPVLIRRETGVGHSSRAVSRAIDLAADELAFLLSQLGG